MRQTSLSIMELNPLAKCPTPGAWLLNSMAWTVACVGGWLLINTVVLTEPYDSRTPSEPLFFLGFVVSHSLVWWRALPGLSPVKNQSSTLGMIAFTWQVGLVAFQIIWLAIMLVVLNASLYYKPYPY